MGRGTSRYGPITREGPLRSREFRLPRSPAAPIDVPIDDRNVYQPDVVVHREKVSWARRHAETPLLAIEVISPTSARRDRVVKTPRLLKAGVEEVWLVDRDGRRISSGDEPIASRAVPGFEVVPRVLFTPP